MSLCPIYIFKYPDAGKPPFDESENYDEGKLESNMCTYLDEIMESFAPIDRELLELAKALKIKFPLTPPKLADDNVLEFQDFNDICGNHEEYIEECEEDIPKFSYAIYKNLKGCVENPYICLTPWYKMCLFDLDLFKEKVAELGLTVFDANSESLLYSPFFKPLGWRN